MTVSSTDAARVHTAVHLVRSFIIWKVTGVCVSQGPAPVNSAAHPRLFVTTGKASLMDSSLAVSPQERVGLGANLA